MGSAMIRHYSTFCLNGNISSEGIVLIDTNIIFISKP